MTHPMQAMVDNLPPIVLKLTYHAFGIQNTHEKYFIQVSKRQVDNELVQAYLLRTGMLGLKLTTALNNVAEYADQYPHSVAADNERRSSAQHRVSYVATRNGEPIPTEVKIRVEAFSAVMPFCILELLAILSAIDTTNRKFFVALGDQMAQNDAVLTDGIGLLEDIDLQTQEFITEAGEKGIRLAEDMLKLYDYAESYPLPSDILGDN